MARRTALNPDGTGFKYGTGVRVERGLPTGEDGHAVKDAEPIWIVYRKVDCAADPDTTYDYRFEPVQSFPETEVGELPDKAHQLADKLASEGE